MIEYINYQNVLFVKNKLKAKNLQKCYALKGHAIIFLVRLVRAYYHFWYFFRKNQFQISKMVAEKNTEVL